MTVVRAEQDIVAVEPNRPRFRPISTPEQESFTVSWRDLCPGTPHRGHDLEGLPDGIGRKRRVDWPGLPHRVLGIPPVNGSLDRLHALPEAGSVVRPPGPHPLARICGAESLLQVARASVEPVKQTGWHRGSPRRAARWQPLRPFACQP